MRMRLFALAAVVAVSCALPARAAETKPPTLIVRLQSVDALVADFKYVAGLAGHADEAEQAAAIIKLLAGEKGLEGVDTKKPIGFYAYLASPPTSSTGALMIPIADEKAFLALVDRFMLGAKKDPQTDVWKIEHEKLPFPLYFRFANDYLYVTLRDKETLDKDKLLAPAAVLPAEKIGVASATLNLGSIPKDLRTLALGQIETQLAKIKEKKGRETEAQQALKESVVDELLSVLKSLVEDEATINLKAIIDRKAGELALEASLAAKPGSTLAKKLSALGEIKSPVAGLIGDDSAANLALRLEAPDKVKAAIGPLFDEIAEQATKKAPDDNAKNLAKQVIKAIGPTIKEGVLDLAVDYRGPSAKELYTAIIGARVKDGKDIDKAFIALGEKLPAEAQPFIAMNAEKVGGVGIHRLDVGQFFPEDVQRQFGQSPIYIAFRDDAAFISVGEKGLDAIKDALGTKEKAGAIFRGQVSLSKLAPLIAVDNKKVPEAAKKAFAEGKDSDKISLTITGGEELKIRLGVKSGAVRFFALLQEKDQ